LTIIEKETIILGLNMFLVSINIQTFRSSLSKKFIQLSVPKRFLSSLLVSTFKPTHV